MVESVQSRWGGLTYQSGLFDSAVVFSPVCDPEESDEPLEIDYAVESASPAGASVDLEGRVLIGFDAGSVREFVSLDSVIECDAMFSMVSSSMSESGMIYDSRDSAVDFTHRVLSCFAGSLEVVPEASGENLTWLIDDNLAVYACATWSKLGLGLPSYVKVWAKNAELIQSAGSRLSAVL